MAKTQYFCAATPDGFIADSDDRIDWPTGFESGYQGPGEKVLDAIDSYIEGVGALVMGSLLRHEVPANRYFLQRGTRGL